MENYWKFSPKSEHPTVLADLQYTSIQRRLKMNQTIPQIVWSTDIHLQLFANRPKIEQVLCHKTEEIKTKRVEYGDGRQASRSRCRGWSQMSYGHNLKRYTALKIGGNVTKWGKPISTFAIRNLNNSFLQICDRFHYIQLIIKAK